MESPTTTWVFVKDWDSVKDWVLLVVTFTAVGFTVVGETVNDFVTVAVGTNRDYGDEANHILPTEISVLVFEPFLVEPSHRL